jgi:hypothetical protein
MGCLSVKSYSRKNGHKKTLVKRVQSRLVAIRPHPLTQTTLPEEAGWHGQSPTLDAQFILIRFVVTVNQLKKAYR